MNNSDWMNSCKTENTFKTKYNTISGVIFLIFGKKTPNMRSLALRPSLFETHCRFPSKSVFFFPKFIRLTDICFSISH